MVSEESFNHYKIGHEHTDAAHWELIELMNAAIVFLKKSETSSAIPLILHLEDKLLKHISEEEQLMKEINYPYIDAHKTEHLGIVRDIRKIHNMIDSRVLKEHIVSHFEETIMNHIDHTDMQIAEYLHK